MTELQLLKPDFTELLQLISSSFNHKINSGSITLGLQSGRGYLKAVRLPSGITVLLSDTLMKNELTVARSGSEERFFVLQFNEEFEDNLLANPKTKKSVDDFQSVVTLSHTLLPETYIFPSSKRLRSVKFFFSKDQLYYLLSKPALEKVVNQYFPAVLETNLQMTIGIEYREMLDDLWADTTNQPLQLNYIQNRVMVLLEKYICKLYERTDLQNIKAKRSDDETVRLMKVESLLVKDFSVAVPRIKDLSRISAMSPTKLKNDFKKSYGLPIYEYFQKNRMRKAHALLVSGRYNIKEVGILVGYTNLSHFANGFKKEFGYLPSKIAAKDSVYVYGS